MMDKDNLNKLFEIQQGLSKETREKALKLQVKSPCFNPFEENDAFNRLAEEISEAQEKARTEDYIARGLINEKNELTELGKEYAKSIEEQAYIRRVEKYAKIDLTQKVNALIINKTNPDINHHFGVDIDIEPMKQKTDKCTLIVEIGGRGFYFAVDKLYIEANTEDVLNKSEELVNKIYRMTTLTISYLKGR